jgi:hypothetical protein
MTSSEATWIERTDEEILARWEAIKDSDFFGVRSGELLCRLPFEKIKPYLKEDAREEDWTTVGKDRETILSEMLAYMPFAWEKANNERGLSASRSMDHYTEWVWLLGDDLGNLSDYEFYGKDNLVKICEKYGWDAGQWDDGIRTN